MERHAVAVFLVVVVFDVVGMLSGGGTLLLVDACSMPVGWRPLSDIERILGASDVLYGGVRQVYPDMRFNYGDGTQAYTAEMDVYCILKGRRTEAVVNITEAGYIPGLCHATNLTVGGRYVVIVRRDSTNGELSPTSREFDATAPATLENLMTACGLQPVYPKGVEASTAKVKCPTPLPPGHCKSNQANSGAGRATTTTATSTFDVVRVTLTITFVLAVVVVQALTAAF